MLSQRSFRGALPVEEEGDTQRRATHGPGFLERRQLIISRRRLEPSVKGTVGALSLPMQHHCPFCHQLGSPQICPYGLGGADCTQYMTQVGVTVTGSEVMTYVIQPESVRIGLGTSVGTTGKQILFPLMKFRSQRDTGPWQLGSIMLLHRKAFLRTKPSHWQTEARAKETERVLF